MVFHVSSLVAEQKSDCGVRWGLIHTYFSSTFKIRWFSLRKTMPLWRYLFLAITEKDGHSLLVITMVTTNNHLQSSLNNISVSLFGSTTALSIIISGNAL